MALIEQLALLNDGTEKNEGKNSANISNVLRIKTEWKLDLKISTKALSGPIAPVVFT